MPRIEAIEKKSMRRSTLDVRRMTCSIDDKGLCPLEEEQLRTLAQRFNAPLAGMAECIHRLARDQRQGRSSEGETLRRLAECLDNLSRIVVEMTGFEVALHTADPRPTSSGCTKANR